MSLSLNAARSNVANAMEALAAVYLSNQPEEPRGAVAVRGALRLLSRALHDLASDARILAPAPTGEPAAADLADSEFNAQPGQPELAALSREELLAAD